MPVAITGFGVFRRRAPRLRRFCVGGSPDAPILAPCSGGS